MKTKKNYGDTVELALNTWVKLARAFNSFYKKSTDNIRSSGLTQPQFAVIDVLGHLGPLKVGEICNKMLVSGGNMTLVLDNLEKSSLIERIHSKEDRRAIVVRLTPNGEKLFGEIFPKHADHVNRLMAVLSPEEQKTLGGLLKKLGTSVN